MVIYNLLIVLLLNFPFKNEINKLPNETQYSMRNVFYN
jgi:hypothetical protein